jgi:hypothetical protein
MKDNNIKDKSEKVTDIVLIISFIIVSSILVLF